MLFCCFCLCFVGFFGEISTIVVPNCCNYSKNRAFLVRILEVTLRIKTTSCVVLVQFPQRCFFPGYYSQNLCFHPLLAHSGVAPLISLSPWHPNTDKKLRDMTASLWELGKGLPRREFVQQHTKDFPFKTSIIRDNIIKHEHRQWGPDIFNYRSLFVFFK